MSGLSVKASVQCQRTEFAEGLLITYRGLSGPSILQILSYWHDGTLLMVNLMAGTNIAAALKAGKRRNPKQDVVTCLCHHLPKRLAAGICRQAGMDPQLTAHNDNRLGQLGVVVNEWQLFRPGSEGCRTAEVTLGGFDRANLLSSTKRAKYVPGLCYIGEVVDVTGHLGAYNFQWAWLSSFVAGRHAEPVPC